MLQKIPIHDLGRLSVEEFKQASKTPITVILDNVRSMHNVGSVFRTADAFAIKKIYLCGITPTPPHREIHKTALGSEDSVQWEHNPDVSAVLSELAANQVWIAAVEQTYQSQPLHHITQLPGHEIALIFGNEVDGVSESALAHCHSAIEIPQWGTKHSLNISVAAGIVLWHFARLYHG